MKHSKTSFCIITILFAGILLSLSAIPSHGQWAATYGGLGFDYTFSIQQTQDQGYIVAGLTDSFGAGLRDVWIMKLDSSGSVTWQKTYGGGDDDYAKFIQQAQDGGYIVVGVTKSFGAGHYDVWIMKLDSSGSVTWQKTYGGANWEQVDSVRQTEDEGYIVTGFTQSFGAVDGRIKGYQKRR